MYIKFISNKFINLEHEKEILDISRSTILRCFKIIKKEFEDSSSEFNYLHGKGIELISISAKEKLKFFKKLMRFFIEEDLLIIGFQDIWKTSSVISLKERSEALYFITKKSKIYMNCFIFSQLCSLEICTDIFDKFEMFKNVSIKNSQYKKISNIVEEYGKNFSKNFKSQLTNFIIDFINNSDKLEVYLKLRTEQFIRQLMKILNIENYSEELKTILFYKIYNSFFKYENNMLKIKKVCFNTNDNLLLDLINKLLKENNWEMFYSDKYIIIQLLKQIIIKNNINSIKNVLILFSEFTLKDKKAFKENIIKTLPSINFDIEISCVYTETINSENKKYDLIISNENISKDILVVDCFDNSYIHAVIEKEIFEKRMKKLGLL